MRSVWSGKDKHPLVLGFVALMLAFFPGCDNAPSCPDEGFDSYRGFRDWWRIPLRFPYQITVIDSFDHGTLERYDPKSPITAPECETIAEHLTAAGFDDKVAPCGILVFASGEIRNFPTKEELAEFVTRRFPAVSVPEMADLETLYQLRWKTLDATRGKKDSATVFDDRSLRE